MILLIQFMLLINAIVEASYMHAHNEIYVKGEILHAVQTSNIFTDCKTFVDMKMKYDKETVINTFHNMMKKGNTLEQVKKFVNKCFDEPGSEFELLEPVDWKKNPALLSEIENFNYKNLAGFLNNLWRKLCRKINEDVKKDPTLYSIIYVPNPVIVPGGRFREFYYWDSYWIILGLLHSEMFITVKGMLENFLSLVNIYGFVPNGGRIYYTNRSQPPLLILMIKEYYDVTKDKSFIEKHIEIMEAEFQFWYTQRTLALKVGTNMVKVARYYVNDTGPRPESYREDIKAASHLKEDKDKNDFYSNLKSSCESGWDFSSRWFINKHGNKGNLTDTKTSLIIPVDLNAILCGNARILSNFFKIVGNNEKALEYHQIHNNWIEAVEALLWDEDEGIWFDYDILSQKSRKYYYASNVFPLWTTCYHEIQKEKTAQKVVNYLTENAKVDSYVGGVPTSSEETGEQWDFPNAWPPLVHIMITGLELTNHSDAKKLAQNLAEIWLESNYKGYERTKELFEKYDSQIPGGYGGGGEYVIQLGFGWTNGVVLDLLHRYGRKNSSEQNYLPPKSSGAINSYAIFSTKFALYYYCLLFITSISSMYL